MFTFAISCLTMPSLPWFMDLTLQVPMQYCSLHHPTLLSLYFHICNESPLHFGPATSSFLELLVTTLWSSPVAYWTPPDQEGSFSGVISFHFFILFMGFSRQQYWSGFPFPSRVDRVLSELFIMTCPPWGALHSPFIMTRLWSMKEFKGQKHSNCSNTQASWLEHYPVTMSAASKHLGHQPPDQSLSHPSTHPTNMC